MGTTAWLAQDGYVVKWIVNDTILVWSSGSWKTTNNKNKDVRVSKETLTVQKEGKGNEL